MTEKLQNALNEHTAELWSANLYLSVLFVGKERAFPEWLAGCRNNLQKRSGMHMPLLST